MNLTSKLKFVDTETKISDEPKHFW